MKNVILHRHVLQVRAHGAVLYHIGRQPPAHMHIGVRIIVKLWLAYLHHMHAVNIMMSGALCVLSLSLHKLLRALIPCRAVASSELQPGRDSQQQEISHSFMADALGEAWGLHQFSQGFPYSGNHPAAPGLS